MSNSPEIGEAYTQKNDEIYLIGGECRACTEIHFPPRPWCPACGGETISKITFERLASLETYSVVEVPQKGFSSPYSVGFFRLSPGNVRVFSPLDEEPKNINTDRSFVPTLLTPEQAVPEQMWGFTTTGGGK